MACHGNRVFSQSPNRFVFYDNYISHLGCPNEEFVIIGDLTQALQRGEVFYSSKLSIVHMINLLYFNISAKGLFQEKTCTLVSTT